MKLFFSTTLVTFFLFAVPLFSNITSVREIEIDESSRAYVGVVENPYETIILTDVILKLSCFNKDALISEVVFPLSKNVAPLASEPFEVRTTFDSEKPCDRYIVEYISYDTLELDAVPILNASPPTFVRFELETNSDIFSVEVVNAGSVKSQNPGITLLVFDDRGAVVFFTQSNFQGDIFPQKSHKFFLRVPIDIQLMTSRFKITAKDKASPVLANKGEKEGERGVSSPLYTFALLY